MPFACNPQLEFIRSDWKGNPLIGNRFVYDPPILEKSLWDVLQWKWRKNPQAVQKKQSLPLQSSFAYKSFSFPKTDGLIWLGHSGFLLQLNGKKILIDPVAGNIPFVKRHLSFPFRIEEIKEIDYLFISHDHRDHFDAPTLRIIFKNNPGIKAFVPLGIGALIRQINPSIPFQEAGWYQAFRMPDSTIQAFCMPAKHWCKRLFNDTNLRLWCSFVFQSNGNSLFFAGDTAYDSKLAEIANYFPNMQYGLMPIGAYAPRYFMQDVHITPEESHLLFQEMNISNFIPMHYGTFDLSDEPLPEPLERLQKVFEINRQTEQLKILQAGEMLSF